MSTRAPTAILPRDLQTVPPPVALIGRKAHALAQLLALKARVPRFGILTVDAFEAHTGEPELRRVIDEAYARGLPDEAARSSTGEALSRRVQQAPLPVAIRIALAELVASFADDDILVARASVVGEPLEAACLAGALDAVLGIRGKEQLEDAVKRLYAMAFHARTLSLRHDAGLAPLGCRIAVVVQRMVPSETSGVCVSLETALHDTAERSPRALIRATWGLAGGIGGKQGDPRIPVDVFRVERPAIAADGVEDGARVAPELEKKTDALRFDEVAGHGARMVPVADPHKREPSLSVVQARMVAREALRVEAAFGKPQVMSFAFAGRLLHVLDTEPLLVPVARIESARVRTWDERLLPAGLPEKVAPMTFSLWQRVGARGVERAGRILGVKGVLLEEVRPQMPRLIGLVSGRVYGNLEVLTALVDLLPFADKARAALAEATGQADLIPRRTPPPGFWQRQRQKLDEGRWGGQLESLAETTSEASGQLVREARATLDKAHELSLPTLDPDSLLDVFDELEDALSKVVAALVMSGLTAMLHRTELEAALAETDLKRVPGLLNDLLGGDVPPELVAGARRVAALVSEARRRPLLFALMREHAGKEEVLAQKLGLVDGHAGIDDDAVRWLSAEVEELARARHAACLSEIALERPRLHERPEVLLAQLCRLVDTDLSGDTLDELERGAVGRRKKAEYILEQTFASIGGLKASNTKKRVEKLLAEVRKHGAEEAVQWIWFEELIAALRASALGLGERLFEHSLLDQPRDVFSLEVPELAGLVRGTGVDADVRPLVAARKRAAVAEPVGLPRRVETRGLVATSLLSGEGEEIEAANVTDPGLSRDLQGRGASSGDVRDRVTHIDPPVHGVPHGTESFGTARGVVVTRTPLLRDIPVMIAARGVVAERGTLYGPAVHLLRALGVPVIVDIAHATSVLHEGSSVRLDAGRGVARRVGPSDENAVKDHVDAAMFAREAVVSDPRARVRPPRPAATFDDMPAPPLVRPASTMDSFVMPPDVGGAREADTPGNESPIVSSDIIVAADNPVHEETDVNEHDIVVVSTDEERDG